MGADTLDDYTSETERVASTSNGAGPSVEDLLAETSGRIRTVWVCPDGELLSEYNDKIAELQQMERPGMLADDADRAAVKREVDELAERIDAKLLEVKLEEVPPGRKFEMRADYFLSKEEAKRKGRRPGDLDYEGFVEALAREAIVEISGNNGTIDKPTSEHIDALLGRSNAIYGQIIEAAEALHGKGADPKEQIATGRRLTGADS